MPTEPGDGAAADGATAANSDRTSRQSKRSEDRDAALNGREVTQTQQTQADDLVPPQLESGASKLDDICPELMAHLRQTVSFCSDEKAGLLVVLRTFVTNKRPRTGRASTDLLVDMVAKEAGLAGHRASRVAGLIRQMDSLDSMTDEMVSLFSSEAATEEDWSDEAAAFGVSDDALNRALAWAWAVGGEVTEVSPNRSQLTQLLSRIVLFTDEFKGILTSTSTTARASGKSRDGRSDASRGAAAEADGAAATAPRGYDPPAAVENLLAGFARANGQGDDDGAADGADLAAADGG